MIIYFKDLKNECLITSLIFQEPCQNKIVPVKKDTALFEDLTGFKNLSGLQTVPRKK